MTAEKHPPFARGNQAARTHGLRSAVSRARNRKGLRRKIRAEVVAIDPKASRVEVELEVDTLCDIEQARAYIESHGGLFSPRGQTLKIAEARDRLVARHENWLRRHGIGSREWLRDHHGQGNDDPFGLGDLQWK